jgi:hypothetical protein
MQITIDVDKKLQSIREVLIKKWGVESLKNDFLFFFK